jgi:hypothetical protein
MASEHSLAITTDDRASDEHTANATVLVRRAWTACAVARGCPRSQRLTTAIMAASHTSARLTLLALFGRGGLLRR